MVSRMIRYNTGRGYAAGKSTERAGSWDRTHLCRRLGVLEFCEGAADVWIGVACVEKSESVGTGTVQRWGVEGVSRPMFGPTGGFLS